MSKQSIDIGADTFYTIYKTTNNITNKTYIGQHITNNINDSYLGSGTYLLKSINKYGKQNFSKEILYIYDNYEDMNNKEIELVCKEYVNNKNTYNLITGGNNNSKDMVLVKYNENMFKVFKDDPKYVIGEYLPVNKGTAIVKDKNGNTLSVSVDDPKYLNGEYVGITKGIVTVKDKNGNTLSVSVNDPKYLNGEYIHVSKGLIAVKDKNDNTLSVSADNPKYLNGEYVGITKGIVTVKDKNGNTLSVSVDDPKYLNGEYVGIRGKPIYTPFGTFNSGGQFSKWLKETLNIDISNTAINAITHINRIDNIIKRNSTSFEKIYGSVFFTHIVENKLTPRQLGWGGIYK